jgi:hypothetical protein
MPGKTARSAARQPLGRPTVTAAAHPPVLPERRKSAKISRRFEVHMRNRGLVVTRQRDLKACPL